MCVYIYIYIYIGEVRPLREQVRHAHHGGLCLPRRRDGEELNGYLDQRVPSLCLANSSRIVLNHAVLKCVFPWRPRWRGALAVCTLHYIHIYIYIYI